MLVSSLGSCNSPGIFSPLLTLPCPTATPGQTDSAQEPASANPIMWPSTRNDTPSLPPSTHLPNLTPSVDVWKLGVSGCMEVFLLEQGYQFRVFPLKHHPATHFPNAHSATEMDPVCGYSNLWKPSLLTFCFPLPTPLRRWILVVASHSHKGIHFYRRPS